MRARHFEEWLFWEIYNRGGCTRNTLADHAGTSFATVSRAVDLLLQSDFVFESKTRLSKRGRRPGLLSVNPRLANLLGLEVDRDRVTAVVIDISGALLGRGATRWDFRQGLDVMAEAGSDAVRSALADAGMSLQQISGLGVGHSGVVDNNRGVCLYWHGAPIWNRARIKEKLQDVFKLKTTIDDRSRAVALGERHASPSDALHRNALYVHAGTGIGSGMFIDGRLYRGSDHSSGHLGHLVIDPAGPLCACGNRGCLEAFAGAQAVVRHICEEMQKGSPSILHDTFRNQPESMTIERISIAATRGDALASAALERAATALSIGIANAVQLLNPSLLVVAGRMARAAGAALQRILPEIIRRQCVKSASPRLRIQISPPKKDSSSVGCALLAAEEEAQMLLQQRLANAAC
jgi:predicted NBD/HSP70 family sugar kinase